MAARKRHDPTSRPADGRRPLDQIRNADPTRHYVYANPNDDETGVGMYLGLGYEIETARPDGPRPAVGKTVSEGGQVTLRGMVLMSCPLEDKAERDGVGWAQADAWDRKILKDGGMEDGLRGRGAPRVDPANTGQYLTTENGA